MKLNYKRTVIIGFAFMSILAFWQLYDQVIPVILEKYFEISTFWTNAIMSVDNILAIFMLPLFGVISDRTNTPLGKRTPYILFGTIFAVILMMALVFFQAGNNLVGFLICLFALLVVMATYRTPTVAYMPDVTEKPLRSKANAVINLVGYIGGIFTTVVMMFLLKSEKADDGSKVYVTSQSFVPVFAVVAAFMLISVLILVLTTKENKLPHPVCENEDEAGKGEKLPKPVKRSLIFLLLSVFMWFMAYNAVTTAFSRYCVEIWQTDLSASSGYLLIATVAAIVAFLPLGFLSSAIGRKRTVLLGILLMAVGYFAAFFITKQTPFMYLIFAVVGIGWAAINVNSYPMAVEMASGSDVGKYTGYYYTFSMAAQIATPLLSGFIIDKLGLGYKILFPYAVIFSLIAFVTMSCVRHGDSKPRKKDSVIENFDVED